MSLWRLCEKLKENNSYVVFIISYGFVPQVYLQPWYRYFDLVSCFVFDFLWVYKLIDHFRPLLKLANSLGY